MLTIPDLVGYGACIMEDKTDFEALLETMTGMLNDGKSVEDLEMDLQASWTTLMDLNSIKWIMTNRNYETVLRSAFLDHLPPQLRAIHEEHHHEDELNEMIQLVMMWIRELESRIALLNTIAMYEDFYKKAK